MRGQANRLRPQRRRARARHQERQRPRVQAASATVLHGLDRRSLLQDDVGVGSGDPKRGHAGATRALPRRPIYRLAEQLHLAGLPIHVRGSFLGVKRLRQHPVAQCQHHLDHAGDARCSLGVTDVALDRPQPQRAVRALTTIRREQRPRLDRIAQRRPRPMRLHHIHITRRQPRTLKRPRNHPLLRRPIRRRQTIRRPILIDRTTPHHRQHPMPPRLRDRQPLQHHHTHTLRPARAIRVGAERPTPPIHRQPPLPRELDEHPWIGHHRRSAGQRQLTLTLTQRLTRQMQRHQRRRTRRIHRHRRTLQPQGIRDATRSDAHRGAGERVALRDLLSLV